MTNEDGSLWLALNGEIYNFQTLHYYGILGESHKLTGLSVLVNTNLNIHKEPIDCMPENGLKAFYESDLDVLAMESCLIVNERKG